MEKLFYEDTHIIEFEGIVTECLFDEKKNCYQVLLDQTAFFPEEGGQVADKGVLGGQEVLDVHIKNDLIYHYVKEPFSVGTKASGKVDWAQRFDFMQQHSGEHIISGLVHKHYGYDNVGFHLGLSEVTLDFNGVLSLEQLREIEAEANDAVWQNLPILVSFPDKEALSKLEYRSKIELTGAVRIVEIPGYDVCACCAPHVDTTGQIGLIKITNVQSHRGGVRVNILCGNRAVADYTRKQDAVSAVSVLLSAKQEAVSDAVKRLHAESIAHKERANSLQAQLLSMQLETLPTPEENENALLFTGALDSIALRNAVNSLTERYAGYCAVFAEDAPEAYHFIIGSSSKDCRELAKDMREKLNAKGGGTAPMIQGSVQASKKALTDYFS